MTVSGVLLNARHIGVRELKAHLSSRLKGRKPIIVTEHGEPTKVIVSYRDMLEIVDVLDELQDKQTFLAVQEGRKAIKSGAMGVKVSDLFGRIRASR
jgi:prevent-host-death family protein